MISSDVVVSATVVLAVGCTTGMSQGMSRCDRHGNDVTGTPGALSRR